MFPEVTGIIWECMLNENKYWKWEIRNYSSERRDWSYHDLSTTLIISISSPRSQPRGLPEDGIAGCHGQPSPVPDADTQPGDLGAHAGWRSTGRGQLRLPGRHHHHLQQPAHHTTATVSAGMLVLHLYGDVLGGGPFLLLHLGFIQITWFQFISSCL